jgi:hypothetical protein
MLVRAARPVEVVQLPVSELDLVLDLGRPVLERSDPLQTYVYMKQKTTNFPLEVWILTTTSAICNSGRFIIRLFENDWDRLCGEFVIPA